jgi:hypothetical protein
VRKRKRASGHKNFNPLAPFIFPNSHHFPSSLLDQLEAHERGEVFKLLRIIAVEDDAVKQRHYVALDNSFAPPQEQTAGIGNALGKLCPASEGISAGPKDFPRDEKHLVQMDEFRTSDRLSNSVFDFE